jgi:hypothetical protein
MQSLTRGRKHSWAYVLLGGTLATSVIACKAKPDTVEGSTVRAHDVAPDPVKVTRVKREEATLWTSASATVMPQYPPASVQRGSAGVAVTSLVIGADGAVRSANVLEAPDAEISRAVKNVLVMWTFQPVSVAGSTVPVEVVGKITLYFDVENGIGRVRTPDEKLRQQLRAQKAHDASVRRRSEDSTSAR